MPTGGSSASSLLRDCKCQKKAYSSGKRGLLIWQKRPLLRRIVAERYCKCQQRHVAWQKRSIHMAKEAYSCGKQHLFTWQKRPTHLAKEVYSHGKRGLFMWPVHVAKEACTLIAPTRAPRARPPRPSRTHPSSLPCPNRRCSLSAHARTPTHTHIM